MGLENTHVGMTGHSGTAFDSPEMAIDFKNDRLLEYLDVHQISGPVNTKTLSHLHLVIIGAGPAGLVLARNTARLGARVTVLEKADDPRLGNIGYTDRSFNYTIDNVGRQVLGDPAAWKDGSWVYGRALHHFNDTPRTHFTRYGEDSNTELVSISRPQLRRNLCELAIAAGADIRFHCEVTSTDSDSGEVVFRDKNGATETISGDLVAYCDGLKTIAKDCPQFDYDNTVTLWQEPRSVIAALVQTDPSKHHSIRHINFWHEESPNTFTIGVPNANGTMGLLLISPFANISDDAHPFATYNAAKSRLVTEFSHLNNAFPDLAEQLPSRSRTRFCYKTSSTYRVGRCGILVGDAAIVFPPYAAYGANQSIYAAGSLAYLLSEATGDVEHALTKFETRQQMLATGLIEFVQGQGDFLSGPVKKNPKARSQLALDELIAEVIHEQTEDVKNVTAQSVSATR